MALDNETNFLAQISDEDYQDAMRDILSTAATLGITIYLGSKGALIRPQTPDRNEPLSVDWLFLEGDQWFIARHLTLGVDDATLAQTPSIASPMKAFLTQVGAITGAKSVLTKLNAYWVHQP